MAVSWIMGCETSDEDEEAKDTLGQLSSDASPAEVLQAYTLLGCGGMKFPHKAGQIGLKNLGNTCFMNAALQCLCHLEPLTAYFLSGQYCGDINLENPLGWKGLLAKAFAELQQTIWLSEHSPHNPKYVKGTFAKCAPFLFESGEQQDVQEFLAFCLDGLHEDMNRVKTRPPPLTGTEEKEDEVRGREEGEEFAAALAWKRHLERGRSCVVDMMQGQLRSTLTCMKCGFSSRKFDPFMYLSVPVDRKMTVVQDTLGKYTEQESLTGDDQWFCEKCKKKVDAIKKIDIWKLPPVLVLHLKRFSYDARSEKFRKILVPISCASKVDLSGLCASGQKDGAWYSPACVANHSGPFGYGHYTATCRIGGLDKGFWRYFDDGQVLPIPKGEDPVGPDAYVIFLVRRPSITPAGEKRQLVSRQSLASPEQWPHLLSNGNADVCDVGVGSKRIRPLKEGWLSKRGPQVGWKWQRRWCVLRPGVLHVMGEDKVEKKLEIDIFAITQVCSILDPTCPPDGLQYRSTYPFSFVMDDLDLRDKLNRQYHFFSADDASTRESWMTALKGEIAKANA